MLFRVGDGVRHRRVRYRLAQSPHYALLDDEPRILVNSSEGQYESLDEWLEDNSLTFFTKELDSFTRS
ncbi:hypothetical protein, partial [Enterobacter hormaechei]|uniref:hypothetical protein n=1 Tax=Enterobacter hormaechei TaxID=158836 RepID=UPI001952D7B6